MFKDRKDAGRKLSERLAQEQWDQPVVFAIPRGGVPIGCEIARKLRAPLDLIIPRKLPVPYNPEAGFGAVAPDGTIVLNDDLVSQIGLDQDEINSIAMAVLDEVQRRIREYRLGPPIDPKGRDVIVVDDGLASGYTMIAAVRALKKKGPKKVVVAVPCSPRTSVERLEEEADEVICLAVQEQGSFAVASYYQKFPDLSDGEVLADLGTCTLVPPKS
ncbi:putative phosphoribosyltransferase [Methanocella arvoryzae MRE50]|uniref:Phosphoribosyltransferase n=2 Tax=Methanocella TaxID=570266 RepID=Q0W5Q3_METAR|nr:putative phosphoribosyltransferase [Methanocella arvoryzae MRE50]